MNLILMVKTTSVLEKVIGMASAVAYKLLLLTLLGGFLVGMLDYFTNHESNKCTMTYMYEIPTYIKIDLPLNTQLRFPRYKLYAYGEGHYLTKIRRNVFNGIPVLFIPGNAGSYKQVRSLATVALRKAENTNSAFHFDYFSIDYNEELSGLFGSILEEQTEFVSACIQHILGFYKQNPKPPKSVVLVGHSMGGVIARAVLTLPSFNSSWVLTILTQAAPHMHPIIGVDFYLVNYYDKVNAFWALNRNTSLAHITLVSFGGGQRDILVRTELTRISKEFKQHKYDLTVASTAVPGVFISIDHLCVVWCRQLVLVIKRAMFAMVDDATKQITEDHDLRMRIVKKFFLKSNTGYSQSYNSKKSLIEFDEKMVQQDDLNLWSYSAKLINDAKIIEVPLQKKGTLAIIAHNLHDQSWIFSCKMNNSLCSEIEDRSADATHLPSQQEITKVFITDVENFLPDDRIFIRLTRSNKPVQVFSKISEDNGHSLTMPSSILNHGKKLFLGPNDVYYVIFLPDLIYEWQAFVATVEVFGNQRDIGEFGVARFSVPWSLEDVYTILDSQKNDVSIKLQMPKPSDGITASPQLQLFLNPSCKYKITTRFSISEFFGQIFRFYVSSIPAFSASILLRTIAVQLKHLHTSGICSNIWQLSKFSTLVDVLIAMLLNDCLLYINTLSDRVLIPMPDVFWQGRRLVVAFLAVFLHVTSQSLVSIAAEILGFIAVLLGNILCFVRSRWKRRLQDDKFITEQHKSNLLPVVFSAVLIAVSYSLCGTFALIVALTFCLGKFIVFHANMATYFFDSKMVLTSVTMKRNLYVSLILLQISICALTIPSLIVFIRDFLDGYGLHLQRDPSLSTAVLAALCSVGIWSLDATTTNGSFRSNKYLGIFSKLTYVMALAILLYGIHNTYRIPVMLCTGFLALSLCSFKSYISKAD